MAYYKASFYTSIKSLADTFILKEKPSVSQAVKLTLRSLIPFGDKAGGLKKLRIPLILI
ncbi:hypothetical protein [Fulvivirga sediminis]|uniref:Uncharacterized protein n=1 Tax=Fulvivirga sediminis TaxID=2803949 RepID=A0A937F8B7_9BACT|nr:hypothetical protein [Fulvivirga sediminis]MBL3656145.1 hypothetical protein [Fulvivirga sediminis]